MLQRFLQSFDEWFSSERGVYQTLLITLLICVAELLFPHLDPHGFWLLYWLTVYSAVTQPALANTGRHQIDRLEKLIDQVAELEKRQLQLLEKQ